MSRWCRWDDTNGTSTGWGELLERRRGAAPVPPGPSLAVRVLLRGQEALMRGLIETGEWPGGVA
jgi:hypothetical protein